MPSPASALKAISIGCPNSSRPSLPFMNHPVFSNQLNEFLQVSDFNSTDISCRLFYTSDYIRHTMLNKTLLSVQSEGNCHEKTTLEVLRQLIERSKQKNQPCILGSITSLLPYKGYAIADLSYFLSKTRIITSCAL